MRKFLTLILLLVSYLPTNAQVYHNDYADCHALYYSLFEKLFTEPMEVAYIQLKGVILIKVTSFEEYHVFFIPSLESLVTEFGYSIGDITLIIHNHLHSFQFSEGDIKFYWMMKRRGFKGLFLLRTPAGTIFEYDNGKVKKLQVHPNK